MIYSVVYEKLNFKNICMMYFLYKNFSVYTTIIRFLHYSLLFHRKKYFLMKTEKGKERKSYYHYRIAKLYEKQLKFLLFSYSNEVN